MDTKPQNNHIAKKPNVLINNLGQLALLLAGGFILFKVLAFSYQNSNKIIAKPTISLPTNFPSSTQIPTKKTEVRTNKITNVKTNSDRPPLPVLSGGNIFGLVNQYRSSKGLPFLSVSNELCGIAEGRADLMMANKMEAFKKSGTGSHFGFDSVNYSGEGVGENLAANVARDVDVLTIWKNSPPHNELMLWTSKDGTPITKGCIATRVSEVGSIVVLLVGDK